MNPAAPLQLTDTHAHLHFEGLCEDLPAVIQRAEEAGVRKILTLGTDLPSGREAVKIASEYSMVYAAVGIHPTDVHKSEAGDTERLKQLAQTERKIVAIGEIGLDLYWKEVPLADQLPVLENMLHLADELNLPVVIHNREAHREMQEFFRAQGIRRLRGVMHSFSGTIADAEFYLDRGLNISFTGVVTFKNFKQTEVVRWLPLNRLLLETDCPFLAPVPKRGKTNEPAFVRYTAEKLAELHGLTLEELCAITSRNAQALFGW